MTYQAREKTLQGLRGETIRVMNNVDVEGRPAGGIAEGLGLNVMFQDGPLQENVRNGAFIEDLIMVAIERIDWYQSGEFSCRENACAKTHLQEALMWLEERTKEREARGVQGIYQA